MAEKGDWRNPSPFISSEAQMTNSDRNLNIVREEGYPSNRMATPITTGFSPSQHQTLSDYRDSVEDGRPTDPLGYFSQQEGKRNGKRRS